jgi:hypothetical protein
MQPMPQANCGQVVVEQALDGAKRMRIWKSADWNRVEKAPTGIPKDNVSYCAYSLLELLIPEQSYV